MPNPMAATETLTPAPSATPVEGSGGLLLEIEGKIVPNYAATMVSFDEGDVVNGKVVRIDKDEVLVDIGYKAEGVIPSNELSIRKSVNPAEEVELGEEVDALVLTKEDAEGRLILSKKRARFEKAWRRIEVAADSGEPVEGSVIEVVKGGLILDLGVRGFLPASLVDIRRVHNLDEFMGQTLECKVIELNRSRNNVVLSRRAVLEEERKEVREQILGRLEPGQVVEGKISNIVDFGAFVDLDGIDGLIHISELSWSHVNHPSEVVAIGDTVRIKVLDIDRDRQRISLGLKQTQEDPWQRVISTHRPGDVLEGTVTKVVAFGAFVEILPGVEGLVHISELADHHVENPSEVVEPGAKLNVKILEIDEDRRRLSLSIKRVEGQNMPMQDLSAQIAAAQGIEPVAGEAPAEGGAEEAAIDLAEDAAVEDQEVESPAVETETVAAEVPEGATAEAAVEDASQAEAAEAAPEASAAEAEAAPADEDPAVETEIAAEPEVEAAAEPETAAAEAEAEAVAEPEAPAAEEPEPEAPVAESNPAESGSEDDGEGDGSEAQEGESAAERPDSPDDTDEASGEKTDSSESE
jgi:small subunit ribosomal protein S1